ncbi:MAG: hypothetical protein IJV77_03225 [Clostridia bacterium]|nr:hypothetical protein [Clostridia bacterium]
MAKKDKVFLKNEKIFVSFFIVCTKTLQWAKKPQKSVRCFIALGQQNVAFAQKKQKKIFSKIEKNCKIF